MSATDVTADQLALQRLYHWELTAPDRIVLTQPMGGGALCLVVTEPWTVESGFLTSTFKVKRNRIEEVYAPRYESWLGARRAIVWS